MTTTQKDFCAAVIDGRALTPRFKQRQVLGLFSALEKSRSEILTAIYNDTSDSQFEAEIQYHQTLDALNSFYASINVKQQLSDEYKLSRSSDNLTRKDPFGYAYIVPGRYHALYSTVVPLAAAIAAGNCVALESPQTASELGDFLRSVLPKSLDPETFLLTEHDTFDPSFQKAHGIYFNGCSLKGPGSSVREIETPMAQTVAIVDASANLEQAARELVRARFSFGGKSPYAPDIVLVNEFSLPEFAKEVTRETASHLSTQVGRHSENQKPRNRPATKEATFSEKLKEKGADILASSARGTVALLTSRSTDILNQKITEPVLILQPTTSMDDAIDYTNNLLNATSTAEPSTAAYFFSDPSTAKYLSQFVRARLTYTNRIPVELLVGETAPIRFPPSIQPRYTTDMFSFARPDHITAPESSDRLAKALDGQISASSLKPPKLGPTDEPQGGAVGFFEQGILTGVVLVLSTLATSSYVTVRYVLPMIVEKMR